MWHSSSCGRIELNITRRQAGTLPPHGQQDAAVEALARDPKIARQLRKIDPAVLKAELVQYGAWSDEELADHQQNLIRYLWIAAGDVREGNV